MKTITTITYKPEVGDAVLVVDEDGVEQIGKIEGFSRGCDPRGTGWANIYAGEKCIAAPDLYDMSWDIVNQRWEVS